MLKSGKLARHRQVEYLRFSFDEGRRGRLAGESLSAHLPGLTFISTRLGSNQVSGPESKACRALQLVPVAAGRAAGAQWREQWCWTALGVENRLQLSFESFDSICLRGFQCAVQMETCMTVQN